MSRDYIFRNNVLEIGCIREICDCIPFIIVSSMIPSAPKDYEFSKK